MKVVLDNNIMKASEFEVSAIGIIPEIAVVKNVRISNVLDEEGKKAEKVDVVRYDCVNPDNFSTFTLKVEATRPVVTKEMLEASLCRMARQKHNEAPRKGKVLVDRDVQ